jgi:tetratricopeptide (TPR) repeat protein
MGDYAEARRWYGRYLDICRKLGDRWDGATAQTNIATLLAKEGRVEEATAMQEQCLRVFEEVGDMQSLAYTHLEMSECRLLVGDIGRAEEHAVNGLEMGISLGSRELEGVFRRMLGRIQAAKGDRAGAAAHFRLSIDILTEIGSIRSLPESFRWYGKMFAESGDPARAREMLGRALELHRQMGNVQSAAELEAEIAALGPGNQV